MKTAYGGDNDCSAITLADTIAQGARGKVADTASEGSEHKDVGNWMTNGVR
jgi:hypothetical protein